MHLFKINRLIKYVDQLPDLHEVRNTRTNLVECEGDLETCEEYVQWVLAFDETTI